MSGTMGFVKLGTGLGLVAAASIWLGVAPAMRKAESLNRRIEAAHGTIVRSNSRAQDIRGLADTLAHAREFSLVHTKELLEGDISVLMHEISGFLTTLHVTSHEMKQDRSEERDGVLVTPVTLTMRATFPDLTRLLAHIEDGERLVRIARIQVDLPRGQAPGAELLAIEVTFESISPVHAPRPVVANALSEDDRR